MRLRGLLLNRGARRNVFGMSKLLPIYTADNISPAWQLDWSVTLFWREPPWTEDWLDAVREALEPDGIRVLAHRFLDADRSQFVVSTLPAVKPIEVIQRLKGRLQYIVRERWPKAFRRNYDLHSTGSTCREKVEDYVASQLQHHAVEDPRANGALADLQWISPDVDLSAPRFSSHGRYRCNLHLVFVRAGRWRETRVAYLEATREMTRRASAAKQHLLSRIGLLPDHLHLTLGFDLDERPIDVALSYMNNFAYVYDMQPVLMLGCFLGTIGEYSLQGIEPTAWLTANR